MRIIAFFIFAFTFLGSYGQDFEEILKMVQSDRAESDRFGYDVDIYENYAIVGAYGKDNPIGNEGAAYIFERTGINDWVEVQILTNSDQESYDRFGYSVAVHGDLVVVGAYGEDEDETGSNSMSKAGSAYIFERDAGGTWNEVQKIVASDRTAGDEFGWDVAIYDSTVVVGAHAEEHDEAGMNQIHHAGSVYIFDRNSSGVWTETQKIVGSERAPDINYPDGYSGEDLSDQFGGSVAIWNDWMVVGAHHHDYGPGLTSPMWSSGAAYIFERSGLTWTEVAKIQNFDREPWDRFGFSVDIDTNIVVVSSYSEDEEEDGVSGSLTNPGSAHIFERDGAGTWSQVQKIVPDDRNSGDHFGYSLAIHDTMMVIGTHSDNHDEFDSNYLEDAGSAYVFSQNTSGVWSQYQKLDASDRREYDDLGVSCAIWETTVMVGAQYQDYNEMDADSINEAGAVYEYNTQNCEPDTLDQALNLCFGETYSIGSSNYTTAGSYTDVLTTFAGCDSVVYTDLTFDPPISSSQDVEICDGHSYSIGTSTYTIAGTYDDTLTAIDGCDSVVTTNLSIKPPNEFEQDVSICWGESYTIGTSTYTENGTYYDVFTGSDWCDSTVITNLTVELPVNATISQTDNYLTANPADASYQWYNCDKDEIVEGATNQSWWAYDLGNWACIVTLNGCTDTSACVYVATINTEEQFPERQISVYPNPNNGRFTIELPDGVTTELEVLNHLGEVILNEELSGGKSDIDLTDFPKGVYHLRLIGEVVVVKRVVVR